MVKRYIFILVLLFLILSIYAEESKLQEKLEKLLDEALQVNITAKVFPTNKEVSWNMEQRKLTIPGSAIKIRLEGENVRVIADLTPYQVGKDEFQLLVEGQIWLSESPKKALRHLTSTFKSIPISLGEKIRFYPLGISKEYLNGKFFNVVLEIQVVRYNDIVKAPAP